MARLEALAEVAALSHSDPVPERGLSIGQYLIRRLQDYGLAHVFGIPGDYVLTFYDLLEKSPIEVVGCTREDCAGLRGRRLCPDQRPGRGVRDVLRRRAEPLQLDRRGLCREVAGGRHQRLAGPGRAGQQSAAAPQGPRLSHAVRGVREALRRRRPS